MLMDKGIMKTSSIDLILYLSRSDIKARYARSLLGPLWLVLTTAISVVGLGYVWSALFSIDREVFIPFLSVGLVVWQFFSSCIIESAEIFSHSGAVIRNTRNSLFVFPFSMLGKNLIILGHNALIIFAVLLVYPQEINLNLFLVIPGLLLVIMNMAWIVTVVAIIGARFRDLGPAISSFMTILFFLSPVMYKPEQLGVKSSILWINPFSHMITAIRDPLLGYSPPMFVYITLILLLVSGWSLLFSMMVKFKNRIIYWI